MNRQRIALAVSVLVFGTWMLVHREALPQNDGGAQPVNENLILQTRFRLHL